MNEKRYGTDLASERRRADIQEDGVRFSRCQRGELAWEYVSIENENGAKSIGRPIGLYSTLTFPSLPQADEAVKEQAVAEVKHELTVLAEHALRKEAKKVLVVGLGNAAMTADAVGPKTAAKVRATRHIKAWDEPLFQTLSCAEISVFSPGVTAQSGMDAAEAVVGLLPEVQPDLILAIDALAARSIDRLGKTVQISDTGIFPGSGVGNHRKPLTKDVLGVPVIAIGVPTVTDSRIFFEEEAGRRGLPFSQEEATVGMFVSPKDIDEITDLSSDILAGAINEAFGVVL